MKHSIFAWQSERGIVLIITLLVLLTMTLASVAIIRLMSTTTLTIVGQTFRSSGNAMGVNLIEIAIRELSEVKYSSLERYLENDFPKGLADIPGSYYASIQNPEEESAEGIPALLQTESSAGVVPNDKDNPGNTARVLIERMCNASGAASENNCVGAKGGGRDCNTYKANSPESLACLGIKSGGSPQVPYRITVRVDGPGHTVSFTQAIINL